MSVLMQDLKFAVRALRKRWLVTGLAVVSLALAIGGNAAVFSMVDAFIFRPLPYPEPERLVLVGEREETTPANAGQFLTSLATATDWAERARSVRQWAMLRPRTLSLRGVERSEAISGVAVTPNVFRVLDARPIRGRLFTEAEAVEGGPGIVLLGWSFWQDRWGPSTDPVGETLTLNGTPHEIIGVLPEGFGFLAPNQDLWVPLRETASGSPRDQRNLMAFGRLRPGVTTEDATEELSAIASEMAEEFRETNRGWTVDVYNMRYDIPTQSSRILFGLLQAAVFVVLVIACVNITNLLLARGQERRREIALRVALGAGRLRIVRQLLTESFLMAGTGIVIGLGLAWIGIRAMANQFVGVLPPSFEIVMDLRVTVFTIGVGVFAGLAFGIAPALQTLRKGHSAALKEGAGRGGSGRSKVGLTRILVVAEIALSFVALGGGSLLVRSFMEIQAGDPGFDPSGVLTATLAVPSSLYPEPEDRHLVNDRILESVQGLQGVRSAALVSSLPQSPIVSADSFRVVGMGVDAGSTPPSAVVIRASPGYPDVLGIELLQGRFVQESDRLDTAPVAVVSRSLAERHLRERGALGRRIEVDGETREIVGVVEDVQQVLVRTGDAESGETIYLPVAQAPGRGNTLALRTSGDPLALEASLRRTLEGIDRDLTLSQVLTMKQYVDQFMVGVQVFNAVLGGFGLIGLLLASIGTYGVLAYSVSRRSREIGIRMALGAEGRDVVAMVVRQGFWMAVIGLVIGGLVTLPLIGLMDSLLTGLSSVRPNTLLLIGALLFGVTMLASLIPARRAARVDPMRTLRDD